MKAVSINVGSPIEIEGVLTSIIKKPVNGSVLVSPLNLAGDRQANLDSHGGRDKAVHAFSTQQYDYWRQALNLSHLTYGQLGENITISDLDEAALCIGDQLQIGDCILEISQPRVPCYKLDLAIGLAAMAKQFLQHGRTGIYLRVIESGSIKAGDVVTVIKQQPQQLPVKTLLNAYYNADFIGAKAVMQTAAGIAELSAEWQNKVLTRLTKL